MKMRGGRRRSVSELRTYSQPISCSSECAIVCAEDSSPNSQHTSVALLCLILHRFYSLVNSVWGFVFEAVSR